MQFFIVIFLLTCYSLTGKKFIGAWFGHEYNTRIGGNYGTQMEYYHPGADG